MVNRKEFLRHVRQGGWSIKASNSVYDLLTNPDARAGVLMLFEDRAVHVFANGYEVVAYDYKGYRAEKDGLGVYALKEEA